LSISVANFKLCSFNEACRVNINETFFVVRAELMSATIVIYLATVYDINNILPADKHAQKNLYLAFHYWL